MARPAFATAFILLVLFASPALAQAPPDPAPLVLAAARQALGGADRLTAIRSFVATGRTRQVQGDNLLPIEFQISWEAPDKYVRTDEFPTQDRGPVTTGFNGAALIGTPAPARQGLPRQSAESAAAGGPPPPGGQPRGAPPPEGRGRAGPGGPPPGPEAQLATIKEDLARLMLGMFAGSVSSLPLTFKYAGLAEAPQGQADVLEATGPGTFAARFFVDRKTHLPVMVSWQSGQSETRLFFADYRAVDGVTWPFRIRRAIGSEPAEETNFDRFRINVKIDPRRFETRP